MSIRCINNNYFLLILLCIVLIVFAADAQQYRLFSNRVSLDENVTNPESAVDGDLSNFATLTSNSGAIGGLAARQGILEIAFDQPLEANQTTYLRLDFEDDIFNALLGGSFGVLLSDVLGTTLLGNHILEIEARSGSTAVLQGETSNASDFTGERLRVVVDEAGDFFLKIKPDQSYDRIWIRDRTAAIVGLGVENETQVFYAFSFTDELACTGSAFTGFDVSGLSVGAFNDEAPVADAEFAIDDKPDTYSKISLGNLSPSGSIRQDIYFNAYTIGQDLLSARIRLNPDLISNELLNAISIIALDDNEEVYSSSIADLMNEEMRDALENGEALDIPFTPFSRVNRVALQFQAGIQISNQAVLEFSGVTITPPQPLSTLPSGESFEVCEGDQVELNVEVDEAYSIRWYDQPEGGELLATTAAGETFNTGFVNFDRTFYAAAYYEICDRESNRLAVEVLVNSAPSEDDLKITGNLERYCEGDVIEFNPQLSESSFLSGSEVEFNWYAANDKLAPVMNGENFAGGNVSIAENGAITITDLGADDYTLFLAVKNTNGCENSDGELLMVAFQILASSTEADIQVTNGSICEGESFTLSATSADVENPVFRFYTDEALTNELTDLTVSPSQTTTYYVTVEGEGICAGVESEAVELVVTVNSGSTPEITIADGNICEGESFTLSATSDDVENPVFRFYTDEALTNELKDLTVSPSQTTTYYVTVEGEGICAGVENEAVELVVTVNSGSTPEITVADGSICEGESITLSATAADVENPVFRFYTDEALTNELTDLSVSPSQTTTYYVTVEGEGICAGVENEAVELVVTVNSGSTPEITVADGSICEGESITLSATAADVENPVFRFYTDEALTNELTDLTVSPSQTTTYYVTVEGDDICTAQSNSELLTLTVTSADAPVTNNPAQEFCESDNPTLAGISVTGENILWYESASSQNSLVNTTPLEGGQTYFASQTINGCESEERTAIMITLINCDAEIRELEISKIASVSTVLAGGQITYTIIVSNPNTSEVADITISDDLDASLNFVSADNAGALDDGTVSWQVTSLPAGSQISLELIVTVNGNTPNGSEISNSASAVALAQNFDRIESDPAIVTVVEEIDATSFIIVKSVNQSTAQPGDEIEYTILVTNTSDSVIEALEISDKLPEELDFLAASENGGLQNGTVTWLIENLGAGETSELILSVSINENAIPGQEVSNLASASLPDDELKESDPVKVLITSDENEENSLVSLIKTQNVNLAVPGELVTYTITISNEGPVAAENLFLVDFLPQGIMVTEISEPGVQEQDEIVWKIPSLAVGEEISYEVQVIILAEDGSLINQVVVTGDNFQEERDQTDPLIIGETESSDIAILKEVSKSIVAVGEEFEYRITVGNKLQEAANSIIVTDTLPVGVEYLSSSATAGISSYSMGDRSVAWTIPSLDSLSLQSLAIKVRAVEKGEITNNATVTSVGVDLDTSDNQSSVSHQQLDFLIPNVFTPNGDGINDTWEILGLSDFFISNQLVVVNRYGVEVFRAVNYQNDWDGNNLAGGTYFYTLTGTDETGAERSITGFLTIIK